MDELLHITWYYESPIDFEHKQYLLLSYLQKVEKSFIDRVVSPHLLHMEKMVSELESYDNTLIKIKTHFDKNRYIYLFDNSKLIGEDNHHLNEIKEIVEFSIPQVKTRINMGYRVLKKYQQILY